MAGDHPRAKRERLLDDWSDWTAIVSTFARRRPARRRIDPRTYATLRDGLMDACRALAESDGERRSYYEDLEETVRPWLSPRVLARTDTEILSALLRRCREVERELSGRRWRLGWPTEVSREMKVIGGVALLVLGTVVLIDAAPVFAFVRDAVDRAWLTLKFISHFHRMSAVAVLMVAVAIYVVMRSVRPGD